MAEDDPGHPNPFVAYHRAQRRAAIVKAIAIVVPACLAVAGIIVASGLGTAAASAVPTVAIASPAPTPTPTPTATSKVVVAAPKLPAPAVVKAPAGDDHVSVSATSTTIQITATGYQKQLDECQWVRMDLGVQAPIVGAHTECGGAVVLRMKPGDTVTLRGEGLDGTYVVVDSRGAHAGEDADTATSGMVADVILQTCYPGTGGQERLVGLVAKATPAP